MSFTHRIRIASRDIDMQRVVASASYLTYVGDVVDAWLRACVGPSFEEGGWDAMLKRAVLDWQSPARLGELLEIEAAAARWGTTSFDVQLAGRVDRRAVFTALATYVSVRPHTADPIPTPAHVRAALGTAVGDGAVALQHPS